MIKTIRTRLAPSPTGPLHVGTARTALFNELFAHQSGGQFIIRIEDTDKERSRPEFEQDILAGLSWLGISWDEGPDIGGVHSPYRQSERSDSHYAGALQKLLDKELAYMEGEAIFLRVASDSVSFQDMVRGTVTISPEAWGGDFAIARSLRDPLYHLAVVVDDYAQDITHVIRGEDHLTNTARHILLQRALDYPQPEYGHLPLLLDEKRRKLSKRALETSVLAYRDKGYLAEAMMNYLALLGWNPKDDSEFFSHEDLLLRFSMNGVQKGGAIFSEEKLAAINKFYIRKLDPKQLFQYSRPLLETSGYDVADEDYWAAAISTEQERIATINELPEVLSFYHTSWKGTYPATMLVWRKSTEQETEQHLQRLITYLENMSENDFSADILESSILAWIDKHGLGRGDVLWPMRVALTGLENSPGPFEIAAVLGKKSTLMRLQNGLRILQREHIL